jgi:sterol desaturase/sphingolipid hydroxylase (fatty acid hydroxylase superfamily)
MYVYKNMLFQIDNFLWSVLTSMWAILMYCASIIYFTYTTKNCSKTPTLSYKKTIFLALFNLFICLPIFNMIFARLISATITSNLSFIELLLILPCSLISSSLVGIIHYFLHKIKLLYKKIHMVHHKAVITQPLDSIYVHPAEFIFSMILPFTLIPFLLGLHTIATCIMQTIAIYENVKSHISYEGHISEHNYHHKLFNVNYDSFPYWLGKYILKSYKKDTTDTIKSNDNINDIK